MKTDKKYKGVPLNDESLEEFMSGDFPRVYIHDIKDNPDDTCSMEISTNNAYRTNLIPLVLF